MGVRDTGQAQMQQEGLRLYYYSAAQSSRLLQMQGHEVCCLRPSDLTSSRYWRSMSVELQQSVSLSVCLHNQQNLSGEIASAHPLQLEAEVT